MIQRGALVLKVTPEGSVIGTVVHSREVEVGCKDGKRWKQTEIKSHLAHLE